MGSELMNRVPTQDELQERMQFYATVGQGISNWARMEGRIINLAAYLLDTNVQKAGVVFYSMNFNLWLNVIDDLLLLDKHLTNIRKRHWSPVSSELRKLNDIRVRLAHHTTWQAPAAGSGVYLRPAREDQRSRSRAYPILTADEILKFTSDTTDIGHRILDVEQQLRAARMTM
ncbi:hypothetical protein [Bradyrhizobium ganzhouense]|uniref:hypothetical protein n=1 Tax=Bradyrhizobium ganzhouense TaxID=1179767 RepID=UPI003CF55CD8